MKSLNLKPLSFAVATALSCQYAIADEVAENSDDYEVIEVVGKTTNTVITPAELEKYQANDLADIFRLVPSVSVGGSLGVAQKVYIRGMEDTLLNVTVDGAPQTSTLFHHIGRLSIDPDLLKEVEVQAGAGEATAGSGAIGGAIRFKTKNAEDLLLDSDSAFGGNIKASYFSNSGKKLSASLYGNLTDDWNILGSFVTINRDLMEDGDGNEIQGTNPDQQLGFIKLSGKITEDQTLSVSYEKRKEDGEFVQRPNWPQSSWNPLYPLSVERETIVLNHGLYSGELVNLETTLYTTEASVEQDVFDKWGIYSGRVKSSGFDIRNTSVFGKHSVTYGVEYRKDKVSAGPDSTTVATEKGTVAGIYVQDHWQVNPQLLVSFGGRFDKYDLDLVTYDGEASSEGFSPNIGLEYEFNENWILNLGYAEAMRGKEIGDSFTIEAGYVTVDPELKAEEVDNTELGITYQDDTWNVVASVYKSDIDNVILDQLGKGTYYENVGKLETKGFELKVGYWYEDLQLVGSYSNNDTELNGAPVNGYEHIGLANSRGNTWGLNANYTFSETIEFGWNFTYLEDLNNIEVFHRIVDIGWATELETIDKPGYQVHDIYAQWQPTEALSLNLTVQNLFNELYRDHSSVGDYGSIDGWEGVAGLYEAGRDIRLSIGYSF